jgi:hypothetical protein
MAMAIAMRIAARIFPPATEVTQGPLSSVHYTHIKRPPNSRWVFLSVLEDTTEMTAHSRAKQLACLISRLIRLALGRFLFGVIYSCTYIHIGAYVACMANGHMPRPQDPRCMRKRKVRTLPSGAACCSCNSHKQDNPSPSWPRGQRHRHRHRHCHVTTAAARSTATAGLASTALCRKGGRATA